MTTRRRPVMVGESRHIAAPPDRVFAELTDAWMFASWVVGATHIRGVDDAWPQPGSRLHHQVGAWPLAVNDSTKVLECERPRRLRLRARAWPFGEAEVDLRVEAEDGGSRVTMLEAPLRGPGRWVDNPLQRLALRLRNREALARLATIVESRPAPSASSPAVAGGQSA